jgi:hypothetical protein
MGFSSYAPQLFPYPVSHIPHPILGVISELKLNGMRVKIQLLFQIGLVVFSNIVLEQRNWHDQGDIFIPILLYCLQKFSFFVS